MEIEDILLVLIHICFHPTIKHFQKRSALHTHETLKASYIRALCPVYPRY